MKKCHLTSKIDINKCSPFFFHQGKLIFFLLLSLMVHVVFTSKLNQRLDFSKINLLVKIS